MSDPDPAGGGGGEGDPSSGGGGPDVTLLPVEKLVAYLSQVVPLLLEDEPGPNSQFSRLLASPEGETLLVPLTKFICDAHCKSMLVQRFVGNKEEDEGGDAEGGGEKERGQRAQSSGPPSISSSSSAMMPASYSIDLNVHFSHARFVSLTFFSNLPGPLRTFFKIK